MYSEYDHSGKYQEFYMKMPIWALNSGNASILLFVFVIIFVNQGYIQMTKSTKKVYLKYISYKSAIFMRILRKRSIWGQSSGKGGLLLFQSLHYFYKIIAGWNDKKTIGGLFQVPPIQKYNFLEVFHIPGTLGTYQKWLKI